MYEIFRDVEEHVPHNMRETRSKILMPTYRFVTSVSFALGLIVIVILFVTMFLYDAYAYTQDVVDRNGIKDITVRDAKQSNTSIITFDYCFNKYSKDSVGALVVSSLATAPVPIDSTNLKYKQCTKYGTTILSDSDDVTVTLFQQDSINVLISSFNVKIHDLKDNLVQTNQKINEYKKVNNDDSKIQSLSQKAQLLESQIKSAQSGLKILIAMKSS